MSTAERLTVKAIQARLESASTLVPEIHDLAEDVFGRLWDAKEACPAWTGYKLTDGNLDTLSLLSALNAANGILRSVLDNTAKLQQRIDEQGVKEDYEAGAF